MQKDRPTIACEIQKVAARLGMKAQNYIVELLGNVYSIHHER